MSSMKPSKEPSSLMVIILKDESLLKKLLSLLIEFELYEATVLDGEAIENIAAKKIPLFSDVNSLFSDKTSAYNRTILAYVPDDSNIERFIEVCNEEGIDFKKPGLGSLMILPCKLYAGQE